MTVPDGLDPFLALFSESTARALVALEPAAEERFVAAAAACGVPHTRLGVTTAGGAGAAMTVDDVFTLPLPELRAAWSATLPAALQV